MPASAGLVQVSQSALVTELNTHAGKPVLLKALLLTALYLCTAHVTLQCHMVKTAHLTSSAVKCDIGVHKWHTMDMRGTCIWVHPASMQFTETRLRSSIAK